MKHILTREDTITLLDELYGDLLIKLDARLTVIEERLQIEEHAWEARVDKEATSGGGIRSLLSNLFSS